MLVALLVIGLVVIAGLGVFGFVVLLNTESAQKKAERNADEILDSTFDGRPDVTFTVNMRTLKYETVITGAKRRGYQLAHQSGGQYGTLIFEKV